MEGALRSKQDAFLCLGPEADVGKTAPLEGGTGKRDLWVSLTKGQIDQAAFHSLRPGRVKQWSARCLVPLCPLPRLPSIVLRGHVHKFKYSLPDSEGDIGQPQWTEGEAEAHTHQAATI